jgi:hypothetical protein
LPGSSRSWQASESLIQGWRENVLMAAGHRQRPKENNHVKVKPTAILLLAVAMLVLVAGCGSKKKSSASTTTSSTTATTKTVGAPGATVSFVVPKNGWVSHGSTVPAKVKVSNFKLAPNQVGKAAVQGEGHLHFSLDGGKYDFPKYSGANGKLAVTLGVQGKYSPSVTPSITYKGIPVGKHSLEVYLANNDHSNTGVEAKTSFMVGKGG